MTLYCGGCVNEIETGFGMVYRLTVEKDGKVLGPDHRLKCGDNQPNCAMCVECWKKVGDARYLPETEAIEDGKTHGHIYAFVEADTGRTSFGTKQWSSIVSGRIVAYLSHETVALFPDLLRIINRMHKSQVEYAARQELCDTKTCDCAKQERSEHNKGAYGLHAGTRVHWKERTPGVILERDHPGHRWLEGEVIRHEHPPHSNYHWVRTDDGNRHEVYEVFEGPIPDGGHVSGSLSNFGGCVGLAIPDRSKLDREKALEAFRVLWHGAAEQVLDAIPKDGTETGATFTGTAEQYAAFEKLLAGVGVEADAVLAPPTEDQLKLMRSI